MAVRWMVELIEHERGYGQRKFHKEYFGVNHKEKALAYMNSVNAKNTSPTAPDCYITASQPKLVEV